ncbi:BREX-1 system adenine-specific DNA-methyltransferase PglX [Lysinibacillus sp. A4]|uniref:BREX-1 system adenine-specific DNA-methyltransferase PglX n=1 Tax=Lysinibacillus sp. A4 TaxID=2976269 RepID=UPI0021757916|nr:BREX-1 system adenine-specific DNA-methyltransferase PglX [Lysinibacillus sp. A4]MCS5503511.1 BREX-1 system adenine-specific DNA-methyltransferase PglX [Lysinibacillus sp. A4]
MNKSALKSFATEARRELLEKIKLQALKLGITPEAIQQASLESSDAIFIDGKPLSEIERKQRNKLIARINEIGYDEVIKEAAYTWFNRFIALRYMEVNDYLPTKVRVLSSVNPDSTEPDMFKEALNLDLPIDKELVYNLKIENNTDELFKYLIKIHCNDLNRYMPFMFETIEGYMEVLFPDGLLGTGTFVRQMTDEEYISEEGWTKVEIVGWLYQYYISEENERVIKAKKRYKAEEIPFATQLFTPEWIVRYMVQNALGRYWIESHPEQRDLIQNWEFYLENPNPEPDFEEKLAPYINKELNVEDIKCFDPAMGSGHILAYMFDVLYEIYSKCGYMEREIPRLIIEKNLYGLDIDERAFQLASFTVVMKALQYNKRFLRIIERDGLEMNLAAIQETNNLTDNEIAFLAGEASGQKYDDIYNFINQFKDAKAIGSLIKIDYFDIAFLKQRIVTIEEATGNLFELNIKDQLIPLLKQLLKQSIIMTTKYDVFVTNPPYAGNKYLTPEISNYLAKNYSDVKSDVFSAFIEYSFEATKENGHTGFMTPFVWMFISSYEKLRGKIINSKTISSLVQLEYSGFDEATVPICTFTLRNYNCELNGEYIRLSDFRGAENQSIKTLEAIRNPRVHYRYTFNQKYFNEIPGVLISYWTTDKIRKAFTNGIKIESIAEPKSGLSTTDNNVFLRYWHEVSNSNIGFNILNLKETEQNQLKWYPFSKGGSYRKWYGNQEYVVNWYKNGKEIKLKTKGAAGGRIVSPEYYFKSGITWSGISSGLPSMRILDNSIFGSGGKALFSNDRMYYLAFLNSNVSLELLKIISPTINFEAGHIGKLPIFLAQESIKAEIASLTEYNISISKRDWDSFETSWDFTRHPMLNENSLTLASAFEQWSYFTESQFNQLKDNEQKLNRIFIDIYGLQDELTPDVDDKDVTVRKADLEQDIKSFISYAVGCGFGRYSLEEEGLVYAGGEFDLNRYKAFPADADNVLPILVGAYFENDIVSRFVEFVRVTFSEETLEENLDFIADALGCKKNETARETIRRYFLNDFYKDHIQTYKKRPIYWLFTSGKEKAFNCLIYMHRYDKTTLSRIRTDYVHEVQNRMDAQRTDLLNIINGDSTVKEIAAAKKELKSLEKKIDELKKYDELLHHMADQQIEIDLDDGVKHNYELFKGLVAKI